MPEWWHFASTSNTDLSFDSQVINNAIHFSASISIEVMIDNKEAICIKSFEYTCQLQQCLEFLTRKTLQQGKQLQHLFAFVFYCCGFCYTLNWRIAVFFVFNIASMVFGSKVRILSRPSSNTYLFMQVGVSHCTVYSYRFTTKTLCRTSTLSLLLFLHFFGMPNKFLWFIIVSVTGFLYTHEWLRQLLLRTNYTINGHI